MPYTAQASDLCLLADVKDYLGLSVTTYDNMLQRMITGASQWIKTWSNRDFYAGSYVQTMDGNNFETISVDQYPITSITGIVIDGVTVLPANYKADNTGQPFITLTDGSVFNKGTQNVVISYAAGYGNVAAGTIPMDVVQACIELVAWRYTERTRIQQSSKSMGGEVVSYSTGEGSKAAMVILANYKRVIP
jgi:hypothetical protein